MSLALAARPVRLTAFPAGASSFALRNWAAMMLALYVAFWLQLNGASSAATCVAILSLQSRGQVLEKALYRMGGTLVGVAVSVVIAGLFCQIRDLFLAACCLWLCLCAVLASLLDGNRAYGAILSGYTVASVALPNVDMPLATFTTGVNQGAAIATGIAAVTIVGDLLWAPDLFPTVLAKLEAAHAEVRAFCVEALRGSVAPEETAALIRKITTLHPDVTALPAESVTGRMRYEAACSVIVGSLRTIFAARVASEALSAQGKAGEDARDNLVRALQGQPHRPVRQHTLDVMATPDAPAELLIAASSCAVLFEQDRQATAALAALREGKRIARAPRLFLYRSRRAALRKGLQAGLGLAIAMTVLSLLDWPAATTILVQIAILIGLSTTNPNPKGFATAALVSVPLAIAAAGVTEFLILDGVDQFQLLTLGMGPTIVVASLLLASGNPKLYGIGFLMIVFFTIILAPANPQNYNPQTYVFASFFSVLAAVALFLLLATILPIEDAQRRDWMLESARADLRAAACGALNPSDVRGCTFRDADRVGQFSALRDIGDATGDLRRLMHMSDLAGCLRRILAAPDIGRGLRSSFGEAVAAPEPSRLRELGREILLANVDGPEERRGARRRLAIDLLLAAMLIERGPRSAGDLRGSGVR